MCGFRPGSQISRYTPLKAPANGENVIFLLGEGEENKRWSLALKPTDLGCILLAVPFPTVRGTLFRPSPAAAHSCVLDAIAVPMIVWHLHCLCQHPKIVTGLTWCLVHLFSRFDGNLSANHFFISVDT